MTVKNIKKYQIAMNMILKEYTLALANKRIKKPLAYALYNVWKEIESEEKER